MNRLAVLLGIAVNFIWALAFLLPYLLQHSSPLLIATGRYLVYGLLSLALMWLGRHKWQRLGTPSWRMAALLAFTGNVGYYMAVTLAIRYAGITVSALIIGVLPLAIMLCGNWHSREVPFKRLLLPALLILCGLLGINLLQQAALPATDSLRFYYGIALALAALGLWTCYAVANATWLKRHPGISPQQWSLAIGVCCLVQSLLVLPWLLPNMLVLMAGGGDPWWQVLGTCVVLGALVSWLATIGWNQVSRQLPVTLAGQLIVFETVASLVYGHLVDRRWPGGWELLCVGLILGGVLAGIRVFQRIDR